VNKLSNFVQNTGTSDGVSRGAAPSPTDTLVALAAAGRNPADITLPTQGSEASGSGETSVEEGDLVVAGVTSGSTSSSTSDATSVTLTTSSPSNSSGNTAANRAAVAPGGSSTTSGTRTAQPDAIGGEEPGGDGGGASGSHLTDGQVAGLMSMGWTASRRLPLRTAGESFPSCSSSLHKRPSQDAADFVSRYSSHFGS
jgi:hypothetical protein